ncbi:hypothetical protein [Amycolatopsis sp. NPDC051128]|uniref:hypothetical protein n=1 Tax=Amycolatopsis sp. NPDC051128 TaxID=3155412 RepID=UPI0034402541
MLWVNHPARLADAAYKPVQLATAARCGLNVPETAITNDPDVVRQFVKGGKTVHASSATAYIDWRTDYDSLNYRLIESPPDVVEGVRSLMTSMSLVYGSLDFVVQPDGTWTFLEINAGGQYGWLEDALEDGRGAPLTDQLADLLAGVHHEHR